MLVSVIIPAYNRAHTLIRSIESVLNQTYKCTEIIIIDDGSTDGTSQIIEKYSKTLRYYRQKNRGPSSARNLGANLANGELISFLDSDDIWLPTKLERQIEIMNQTQSKYECCVCNAQFVEYNGLKQTSFEVAQLIFGDNNVILLDPMRLLCERSLLFNQTALITRSLWKKLGGYQEDLRILEDYEFSTRAAQHGEWVLIAEPLVVKYNDTIGIGVEAMNNEINMRKAYILLLQQLLFNSKKIPNEIRRLIYENIQKEQFWLKLAIARQSPKSYIKATAIFLLYIIKSINYIKARSFKNRFIKFEKLHKILHSSKIHPINAACTQHIVA